MTLRAFTPHEVGIFNETKRARKFPMAGALAGNAQSPLPSNFSNFVTLRMELALILPFAAR